MEGHYNGQNLSLFSNAALGGHYTEFNQALPHVQTYARFENDRPKFVVPPRKAQIPSE